MTKMRLPCKVMKTVCEHHQLATIARTGTGTGTGISGVVWARVGL